MADHKPARTPIATIFLATLVLLLAAYVGTFYYLSRYGDPEGSRSDAKRYYFADTMTPEGEELHLLLCRVYWPLIEVDYRLVTGRRPGLTVSQVI